MIKQDIIETFRTETGLPLLDAIAANYRNLFPNGAYNIENPEEFIIATQLQHSIFDDNENVTLYISLDGRKAGSNIIEVELKDERGILECYYYSIEDFATVFQDLLPDKDNIKYIDINDVSIW